MGGLEGVKKNKLADLPIELHSDSSLLIKTLNQGWKRKANLDLWTALDQARESLNVKWFWVKGHAGHPLNERCDQLAITQSKKAQKSAPESTSTRAQIEYPEGEYRCNGCGTVSEGNLGYRADARMIRVDCPHCGRYIKFATQTPQNLARAKKRPLIKKKG